MEDILASIRRIIADDQSQGQRPPQAPRRGPAPAPTPKAERPADYGEVLDLGRMPPAEKPQARPEPVAPRPLPAEPPFQPEAPRSSEPPHAARAAVPASGPAPGHVNGYASPTLVRGSDAGAATDRFAASVGPEPSPRQPEPPVDDGLVSPALGTSVMSAFETLAATVVLQNTDLLDRVMRELMRPMIKSWLDENLPTLVERLVRTEIERMARGNRP